MSTTLPNIWSIRGVNNGLLPSDVAGISSLTRERKHADTDVVTFKMDGVQVDADPVYPQWSTVVIYRNGVTWFTGIVTKIKRYATPNTEGHSYVISGPWWYLENLIFQQMWATTTNGTNVLISSSRSHIIIGQKVDGTKMNLGQVMTEVLQWCISAGQNGLLQPNGTSSAAFTPFALGTMSPDLTIPYSEVTDKTCADLMAICLRWLPDTVTWFDYSQTIPVLNVSQRFLLPVNTVTLFGRPITCGFSPTARYDLQVPAVFAKFEETNTVDSVSYDSVIVQQYPLTAPDNAFRNFVQTIDLVGGSTTYLKQAVVSRARPVTPGTGDGINWLFKHNSLLQQFDSMNNTMTMAISQIVTTADPDDPANSIPGFDSTCGGLQYELISGAITPWMYSNGGYIGAKATMQVSVQYTGTDAPTKAYFAAQPVPGTVTIPIKLTLTNATTQTYSTVSSQMLGEPVPSGYAQRYYNALNPLHWEGTINFNEPECSDPLPPGCIFNTLDGRTEWQSMNALVLSVSENVDRGLTTVQFGPPLMLGLRDWAELLRAARGKIPTYKLQQRTTAMSQTVGGSVPGHTSAVGSDTLHPPYTGGGVVNPFPFEIMDMSDVTGLKVQVNPDSVLQYSLDASSALSVSGLGAAISASVGTQIWLEVDFDSAGNSVTASIQNGSSGWSGYPAALAYSGSAPNQIPSKCFLMIGYIVASTSSHNGTMISGGPSTAPLKAKIVQCVTTGLLMRSGSYNGQPSVFPYPHSTPYVP